MNRYFQFLLVGIFTITGLSAMEISELSPHETVQIGNLERVNQLLHNGADVNQIDNNGQTPLIIAAFYGHTEIVEILCKNKADVNKAAGNGTTPSLSGSS